MAHPLTISYSWAINWLLRWPLDWVRRQMGHLLRKCLMVALAMMLVSIVLCILAPMLHQETLGLSLPSAGDPTALMIRPPNLPKGILTLLRDALLHIAALLSFREPLTIANLLRHRDRLQGLDEASSELWACLDRAVEEFSKEPPAVQANARLSIQCAGRALEFLSGQGDCEISVYLLRHRVRYSVEVRTAELYLARLAVRPEPLSVDKLLMVRHRLQAWGALTEELRGCLDFAVQKFTEEPFCVQDDARMVVDCAGQALRFSAGAGGNQINVYDDRDGRVHYRIRASGLWARTVRFLNGN
ncbi:uncharacterized protein LOC115643925 [Gopherus evgoodei]|uniref:uncharacterized protein LOC115643925 n=1 Tax=Gopherus evgoodei TaxID=1825980 RepID=UPI0011CFF078|nr:uncharacterized protein LOC115643925 [Gopherus evgoodei]